jgi:hypothetical protein
MTTANCGKPGISAQISHPQPVVSAARLQPGRTRSAPGEEPAACVRACTRRPSGHTGDRARAAKATYAPTPLRDSLAGPATWTAADIGWRSLRPLAGLSSTTRILRATADSGGSPLGELWGDSCTSARRCAVRPVSCSPLGRRRRIGSGSANYFRPPPRHRRQRPRRRNRERGYVKLLPFGDSDSALCSWVIAPPAPGG